MANKVFANGMEIACKAAAGKVICAFPDVCMTPPENPATPPGVPVPYPNTAMASDTTDGSKNVKISDKEIMLKNKSCFKTSTGDEAGSAAKKGVISSKNKGKVYFIKWSMNVKVEGENVDRHFDMTTNNHGSPMANEAVPWPYVDSATLASDHPCKAEKKKEEDACASKADPPLEFPRPCTQKCKAARRCHLTPYESNSSPNCCPPEVAHHIVPISIMQVKRGDSSTNVPGLTNKYTEENALCVCASGEYLEDGKKNPTPIGTHKEMHTLTSEKLRAIMLIPKRLTLEDTIDAVAKAHNETFRKSDGTPQCRQKCIASQLKNQFKECGTGDKIEVREKDGTTWKVEKHRKEGSGGI